MNLYNNPLLEVRIPRVVIITFVFIIWIRRTNQQVINACTIGNNPCTENAECYVETLFIGAPKCRCPNGFQGDGLIGGTGCQDIDECAMGIHTCEPKTQRCINTIGSYECECLSGFRKHEQRLNVCVDIDECMELSVCPSSTLCINTEGSFKCECLDRELIFDQGRCRPINKCTDFNGRLNDCSQNCVLGSDGRGKCECNPGFKLHEDRKTCVDINECEENNPCDLSISSCINIPGSYICDCFKSAGYMTSPINNKICININECEEDPMICGDLNMCCKDLAPPDKYECVFPSINSEVINRIDVNNHLKEGMKNVEGEHKNLENNSKYIQNNKISRKWIETNKEYGNNADSIASNNNSGCYDSDIEYPGYTIQILHSLTSAFDCQLQCQVDLGCDFFTYDMMNRVCLFKAAKSEPKESPGMISGPKYCNYKKISKNKLFPLDSASSQSSLLRRMSSNNNSNKPNQISDNKCPPGFNFAYDIWRKQKNKRTMEVIQKQFGTKQMNSINPVDISEGLQSNTNFMANQINQWYDVFSNVPTTFSNTTKQTNKSVPKLESSNINPGFIAGGIPPPPRGTNFPYNEHYKFNQYQDQNSQIPHKHGHNTPIYGMKSDNSIT
ncbi:Calcium-binding EGF domain protein [Cryptosporidium hominis]|nr:fibrillin 2; syndatyly ems [Cryptosporidium hominis TU502]OLQ19118.1 Fibrillin-2 [Cryptosporidium hominis]PPA65790.1 Calcium-binding EGF domain protein [Cryptosporidium hominis]